MELESYFDFAENDYNLFMFCVNHEYYAANMLGAIAQGICEKYIKHLLESYYSPDSALSYSEYSDVMRTHSLHKLCKFLKNRLQLKYSQETENLMYIIDGFYFSTRYPGDDSITLEKENIDFCCRAINACREETINFMKLLSAEKEKK